MVKYRPEWVKKHFPDWTTEHHPENMIDFKIHGDELPDDIIEIIQGEDNV